MQNNVINNKTSITKEDTMCILIWKMAEIKDFDTGFTQT